jgi:hypothetical protein
MLTRRTFLKALALGAAGLALPAGAAEALVAPERRLWALDGTMLEPAVPRLVARDSDGWYTIHSGPWDMGAPYLLRSIAVAPFAGNATLRVRQHGHVAWQGVAPAGCLVGLGGQVGLLVSPGAILEAEAHTDLGERRTWQIMAPPHLPPGCIPAGRTHLDVGPARFQLEDAREIATVAPAVATLGVVNRPAILSTAPVPVPGP